MWPQKRIFFYYISERTHLASKLKNLTKMSYGEKPSDYARSVYAQARTDAQAIKTTLDYAVAALDARRHLLSLAEKERMENVIRTSILLYNQKMALAASMHSFLCQKV